jgi:hypothetical protein
MRYQIIVAMLTCTFNLTAGSAAESVTDSGIPPGRYVGTYICGQGVTPATLEIDASPEGGRTGRFSFGGGKLPEGSYTVKVKDKPKGELVISPVKWLTRPEGYTFVEILVTRNDERLIGRVNAAGCGEFNVVKEKSDLNNLKVAEAPNATSGPTLTNPESDSRSKHLLVGRYVGTYICAQQLIPFTVEIDNSPKGGSSGIFMFGGDKFPTGSYTIAVNENLSGDFVLVPVTWIKRPPGFSMANSVVHFTGNRLIGRVNSPNCGELKASRIETAVAGGANTSIRNSCVTSDSKLNYVGECVDGKAHGVGLATSSWPNYLYVYEGNFRNGRRDGYGVAVTRNMSTGNDWRVEGEWRLDQRYMVEMRYPFGYKLQKDDEFYGKGKIVDGRYVVYGTYWRENLAFSCNAISDCEQKLENDPKVQFDFAKGFKPSAWGSRGKEQDWLSLMKKSANAGYPPALSFLSDYYENDENKNDPDAAQWKDADRNRMYRSEEFIGLNIWTDFFDKAANDPTEFQNALGRINQTANGAEAAMNSLVTGPERNQFQKFLTDYLLYTNYYRSRSVLLEKSKQCGEVRNYSAAEACDCIAGFPGDTLIGTGAGELVVAPNHKIALRACAIAAASTSNPIERGRYIAQRSRAQIYTFDHILVWQWVEQAISLGYKRATIVKASAMLSFVEFRLKGFPMMTESDYNEKMEIGAKHLSKAKDASVLETFIVAEQYQQTMARQRFNSGILKPLFVDATNSGPKDTGCRYVPTGKGAETVVKCY